MTPIYLIALAALVGALIVIAGWLLVDMYLRADEIDEADKYQQEILK